MSSRVSAKLKRQVFERARACCEYCLCQAKYSSDPFSIEHIIPVVKGGLNESVNLALACQGCNGQKYDKIESIDPVTQLLVPLYNPRLYIWNEHFEWHSDYCLIVGLTPTGRATVELLNLNREGVVNLRFVLHTMGQHPPNL